MVRMVRMVRSLADRTFQPRKFSEATTVTVVKKDGEPDLEPSVALIVPDSVAMCSSLQLTTTVGGVGTRVERFDRRGTEPFEPFEPFEFFQNSGIFPRKFKNFRKINFNIF